MRRHYLLFSNGGEGERVYGCYLHIDVANDGKVWVQHDGTDVAIAEKLLEKGIPKIDIVLGFHAPFVRVDTEGFAVA
ncbi:MAG: XisI protein [Lewinellaceae bacterium]|nr:XisI protein [Lewinellaceae bacterium]